MGDTSDILGGVDIGVCIFYISFCHLYSSDVCVCLCKLHASISFSRVCLSIHFLQTPIAESFYLFTNAHRCILASAFTCLSVAFTYLAITFVCVPYVYPLIVGCVSMHLSLPGCLSVLYVNYSTCRRQLENGGLAPCLTGDRGSASERAREAERADEEM